MTEHLEHVKPFLGSDPIETSRERYNLTNLHELNDLGFKHRVFLTSDDNVEDRPDWLGGENNKPAGSKPGENCKTTPTASGLGKCLASKDPVAGRSDAPVVVIVVDKGNGVVDAFYHFFYCYNLGNKVLRIRWGNHVGDWEHTVVRFMHGKPTEVFFSEHIYGTAFTYDAVEKIGKRPVEYSATGTHAMYAKPGIHRYVLPFGLLQDVTDRGPLWDPLLNMHSYTYNLTDHRLRASTLTPHAPTEWFYFVGHWGDKAYPLNDSRQYYFAGQYHYVNGPYGPIYKNLGREHVCMNPKCDVQDSLQGYDQMRSWPDGRRLNKEEESTFWRGKGMHTRMAKPPGYDCYDTNGDDGGLRDWSDGMFSLA